MSNFTAAQLQELEVRYGLVAKEEHLPVRDGLVRERDMVWWRCSDGPEHVMAGEHWSNIESYPNVYSIAEPITKIEYLD